MKKGIVLDSSAIIRSDLDFSAGGYYTTSQVVAEIRESTAKQAIDYGISSSRIKIVDPGIPSRERVVSAATDTGDIDVLSDTDVSVLALALETGHDLASDDYAIQNVSEKLGITYLPTFHDGITRSIRWVRRCIGCGRVYKPNVNECSVCGQQVIRRRK
ncbi:NOB1 family endonuclease [Candidatus Altiarchaeota archaeon]